MDLFCLVRQRHTEKEVCQRDKGKKQVCVPHVWEMKSHFKCNENVQPFGQQGFMRSRLHYLHVYFEQGNYM